MLQQTLVATVVPYFERFLSVFPTVAALAAADEQEVLHLWSGLGYYRRARDMHRAARQLVEAHGASIPDDPEILAELPGLGRYTRNAILSQAFERRLPILEANTQRLLSRLFGRTEDPRQTAARKWLWQAAEEVLPPHSIGEFNQALMELGALVCTPMAPRCESCPLAARCVAFRLGKQESIPARPAPQEPTQIHEAAVVIRRGESLLLVQRPATGRWANLWEFPHGPLLDGEALLTAAKRLAAELVGIKIVERGELLTLRHGVTRYRITLTCLEAQHVDGEFQSSFYQKGQWLASEQLTSYPVSSPQRRLIQAVLKPHKQRHLFD